MQLKAVDWNVNVPGRWNLAIFSPKFVGQDIFEQEKAQMELLVPVDATGPIYKLEGLQIHPAQAGLGITPEVSNMAGLQSARDCMVKVLQLLQRTPISACGFNLRYAEAEDDRHPFDQFRGPLAKGIDAALGLEPFKCIVGASYPFHDGFLNYELNAGDGPTKHHFNFHLNTDSQDAAIAWLKIDLEECRELAHLCLKSVYSGNPQINEN